MRPAEQSRRFLACLERIGGEPIFLGQVEGTALEVYEQLRCRWPRAYKAHRINLQEVARD